jgi:formylglycine-generating enzyme required for sulfatase activity
LRLPSNETPVVAPTLVHVPGGSFLMGNDRGRPDEQPAHRVTLSPFRVAVAPVTNAEYARFVAATGNEPSRFADDPLFNAPDQPVVGVSWFDAVAYCDWLAASTGLPLRLPTEAERELASRGGTDAVDWPWPGRLEDHPSYAAIAALDRTHAPRPECANGLGLRCMAENVHEWCSDWYDPRYYADSPPEAPVRTTPSERRASRGGSWRHQIKFTRLTARSSLAPDRRYNDYGFRVYVDG